MGFEPRTSGNRKQLLYQLSHNHYPCTQLFTWQLCDKLLEVSVLQGSPQVGVRVPIEWVQVEPHCAGK